MLFGGVSGVCIVNYVLLFVLLSADQEWQVIQRGDPTGSPEVNHSSNSVLRVAEYKISASNGGQVYWSSLGPIWNAGHRN